MKASDNTLPRIYSGIQVWEVEDDHPGQALERDLAASIEGEVRFDRASRAAYSTDASNYRQVPTGVVIPKTTSDVVEAVHVCRRHFAAITSRGGGTSLAGQAVNGVSDYKSTSTTCFDRRSIPNRDGRARLRLDDSSGRVKYGLILGWIR